MPSFDNAFANRLGETGFPLGITMVEVSGLTGVGKTTFVLGMSGLLATKRENNVALLDLEGFDPTTMISILESMGFDGKLYVAEDDDDETAMDNLLGALRDKKNNYGVGILDSIGAISPISEAEGDLGDANMGRRAKLVAQFSRKALKILRDSKNDPKVIFCINHLHPIIGGRGFVTPGGETSKYLFAIRIRLKRKEEFPDGSYVLEGKVVKNRYGYKDRVFHVFILAGKSIHKGLTCMYDGILSGLVERKKVIKIGENSFGSMKSIVAKAQEGDEDFFIPFINLLNDTQPITSEETEDEDMDAKEDEEDMEGDE